MTCDYAGCDSARLFPNDDAKFCHRHWADDSPVEPDPDFTPLREWMGDNDAAGTLFVPCDLEWMYESRREDDDRLPPYAEVRDALLDSWVWRKGMADIMSERGSMLLEDLIGDVASGNI